MALPAIKDLWNLNKDEDEEHVCLSYKKLKTAECYSRNLILESITKIYQINPSLVKIRRSDGFFT
jgi:hypothetical protein